MVLTDRRHLGKIDLAKSAPAAVTFTVEVDFQGIGRWHVYRAITVPPGGYAHHEFPDGFSAHWVRVTSASDCTATAQFPYT